MKNSSQLTLVVLSIFLVVLVVSYVNKGTKEGATDMSNDELLGRMKQLQDDEKAGQDKIKDAKAKIEAMPVDYGPYAELFCDYVDMALKLHGSPYSSYDCDDDVIKQASGADHSSEYKRFHFSENRDSANQMAAYHGANIIGARRAFRERQINFENKVQHIGDELIGAEKIYDMLLYGTPDDPSNV